jgi:hypothetical protein
LDAAMDTFYARLAITVSKYLESSFIRIEQPE